MEWMTLTGRSAFFRSRGRNIGNTTLYSGTPGNSNTKGNYFLVSEPVSFDSPMLILTINGPSQDILMDITTTSGSLGGLIISNLLVSGFIGTAQQYWFPIAVPADTPIFARAQVPAAAGTNAIQIGAMFVRGRWFDFPTYSRVTTYGANEADSGGIGVDPGAAANTWGSWTTITSGTIYPMEAFCLAVGDQNNVTQSVASYMYQVGIGPVGQEIPIFTGFAHANTQVDMIYPNWVGSIPSLIPEGTRISVRAQCSITDATDRLMDFVLYGFD